MLLPSETPMKSDGELYLNVITCDGIDMSDTIHAFDQN